MQTEIEIQKKLGKFFLDIQFHSDCRRIGILGASGSGKSMLLKSIAGIETPDQGRIMISGKEVFDSSKRKNLKPQKRKVGYLFQNYALFPTMTVRENIGAGLFGNRAVKEARVNEMMGKFQISGLEDRLPGELSGGQQQRVALARIMAYEPDVILLDEPFSALDMFLKDRLQQELKEMLEDYGGTVILVSHDRDEIYRFSDELLIINEGRSICQGNTREVFRSPGWKDAARLTGCKNITEIRRLDEHTLEVPDWGICLHLEQKVEKEIRYIGMRAHDFVPYWGKDGTNCIPAEISSVAELPFERRYFLRGESGEEICWFIQREQWKEVEGRGIPPLLRLPEEKLLLLR